MAILLDGKATSAKLQEEIRTRVQAHFTPENAPRLCVILVGENPASASYVRTKCKMAEKLGFRHEVYHFDADVEQSVVEAQIDAYEGGGNTFMGWTHSGENSLQASLDMARARCRNAEREIVKLAEADGLARDFPLRYVNRLSDLLYLMAQDAAAK